jgi:hypothetical protein
MNVYTVRHGHGQNLRLIWPRLAIRHGHALLCLTLRVRTTSQPRTEVQINLAKLPVILTPQNVENNPAW